MKDDQLTDLEKKLFSELKRETSPPDELKTQIMNKLIQEGLIKNNSIMKKSIKWAASIAAAILIFFSGVLYEQSNSDNQISIEPSKGYMLILHEGPGFEPGDPVAMFNEYRDWMINTFEKGVKITGQELKDEASIVSKNTFLTYSDDETVEKTTGYFLLEADSMEDALEVAKANPHIKYGGSIEVKAFMVR